jgi:hypothetical protein
LAALLIIRVNFITQLVGTLECAGTEVHTWFVQFFIIKSEILVPDKFSFYRE